MKNIFQLKNFHNVKDVFKVINICLYTILHNNQICMPLTKVI